MAETLPSGLLIQHVEPKRDPSRTMKACRWLGNERVELAQVGRPLVTEPNDAIVRITSTTICGSDLHLYTGAVNSVSKTAMQRGDILGHEFMGVVEDIGPNVRNIRRGQRVVVSAVISCGQCNYCQQGSYSCCDNTNPSEEIEKLYGHRLSGIFGYSHLTGGFPGGQAEYARVPFADVNLLPIPDNLRDEQVLFLSDIVCTGWHGNELGEVSSGKVVCIWGCGPVGLMNAMWAKYRGASRVIVIDKNESRLQFARERLGVDTINREKVNVDETLKHLFPKGVDVCIEAAGFRFPVSPTQKLQMNTGLETDATDIINEMVKACRKCGNMSLIGDYFGYGNAFPIGPLMEKAITLRGGQVYVQKYWRKLLDIIARGEVDPTFVITHDMPLENIVEAYRMFNHQESLKIVLKPSISR